MNNVTVQRCRDAVVAAKEAAELVVKAMLPEEVPILLLTSGGSAIRVLEFIDDQFFSPRVTLSVLDDRFVQSPVDNNFLRIATTKFYQRIVKAGVVTYDTSPRSEETFEAAGERYDTFLHGWMHDHESGRIVIIQGVGPEGHTAGIMPFPENPKVFTETFVDTERWGVSYDAAEKSSLPLRITATIAFLRMVDFSIVYMCGEDKKDALKLTLESPEHIHEVPSRVIHTMRVVHLFTDIPE